MKELYLLLIIGLMFISNTNAQKSSDEYFQDLIIEVEELEFNSPFSEFGPSIVEDNLLFSAINYNSGKQKRKVKFYDLFASSINEDGIVGSIKMEIGDIETKYHEGPVAYCKNTGELFISLSNFNNSFISFKPFQTRKVNLKIAIAKIQDSRWVIVDEFQHNNNSYFVGHPAISKNGDTLIFVSDMPGGYGKTDLYRCIRTQNGWSKPKNLGENINTSATEFSPFISSKGILFYSSNGFSKYEGLNIYAVDLNNKDDIPLKLPKPINSDKDDFGFIMHESEEYGFFTSVRQGTGSDDIYKASFTSLEVPLAGKVINKLNREPINGASVKLLPANGYKDILTDKNGGFSVLIFPNKVSELVGSKLNYHEATLTISDPSSVLVELMPKLSLELTIQDGETKETLSGVNIDFNQKEDLLSDQNGKLVKTIEGNQSYYIRGTMDGYLDNSLSFSTSAEPALIRETLELYKKEVKKSFTLKNIYYDFDKWDILPKSEEELNKLVLILKENPGLRVELGSHTDSRGNNSYNMRLSQKRSESAVNYILGNRIDRSQISAKGYGESQLHIKNAKTEDEHQMNRKTNFTILEVSSETPVNKSQPGQQVGKKSLIKANADPTVIHGLNYRIQIHATKVEIDIEKELSGLNEYFSKYGFIKVKEGNFYKYQLGPFSSMDKGLEIFNELKDAGNQILFIEYQGIEKIKILKMHLIE